LPQSATLVFNNGVGSLKSCITAILISVTLSACSSITEQTYTFNLTNYDNKGYAQGCSPIIPRKITSPKATDFQKFWSLSLNCANKKHDSLKQEVKFSVTGHLPANAEVVGYVFLKKRNTEINLYDRIRALSSSALRLGGNYGVPVNEHELTPDGVELFVIYRALNES